MSKKKKKPAKKKAAVKKAAKKKTGKIHVGFSVTKKELAEIHRRAEKYGGGNVSAFMRHAAFTCKTSVK